MFLFVCFCFQLGEKSYRFYISCFAFVSFSVRNDFIPSLYFICFVFVFHLFSVRNVTIFIFICFSLLFVLVCFSLF
jgi:hypothetical protein